MTVAAQTVEAEQLRSAQDELADVERRLGDAERERDQGEALAERADQMSRRMAAQLVEELALGKIEQAEYDTRRAEVESTEADALAAHRLAEQKALVLRARALELVDEAENEQLVALDPEQQELERWRATYHQQLAAIAGKLAELDEKRAEIRLRAEAAREDLDPAVRQAREASDREHYAHAARLVRERPRRARELATTDPIVAAAVADFDAERERERQQMWALAEASWAERGLAYPFRRATG